MVASKKETLILYLMKQLYLERLNLCEILLCSIRNAIACRQRDITISCILMSLRERPFSQASYTGIDRNSRKFTVQFD